MNNNKGLWIVLTVIVVILIIWGIVAAYNHNEVAPTDQGLNATSTATTNGGASSGSNSGNSGTSNGNTKATNPNSPIITSLTPNTGRGGIVVTISGARFTSANNKISFGGLIVATVVSNDALHISFTVPDSYKTCTGGNCANNVTPVDPGIYPVAVTNANGTSNIVNFTLTASNLNK